MFPLERQDERYRNDAEFKAIVDLLMSVILKLDMTPDEVREAAMYAALRAETMFPKPLRLEIDPTGEKRIERERRYGRNPYR